MKRNWFISGILLVSMLLSAVSPIFAADIPEADESLVAWYNFDESSIEVGDDGTYIIGNAAPSSNVGDAVLRNGAEAFGSFKKGLDGKGVLYLAGGNANTESPYLQMADNLVNSITGDYTISMMVKRDTDCPAGSWIMSISRGANTQPFFYIAPNGNTYIDRVGNNRGLSGINPGMAVPTGQWTNISVTYDSDLGLMTEYMNGEPVGTASVNNNDYRLSTLFSDNTANYLGKSVWADPYFKGWISDFRLYNRPLDAEEISEIQDTAQDFEAATGDISSDAWSAISEDKRNLNIGGISELYTSISLDTNGANGSSIKWTSSNEDVLTIENGSAVAHPGSSSVTVTLTAELSYGGLTVKKSFVLTVLEQKGADEIIPLDKAYIESLSIEPYEETETEITFRLPLKGIYGSDIEWDFADDYNNKYSDKIEPVNNDYTSLKVRLAANGYMPRMAYLKAVLSYDGQTDEVSSVPVDITPQKSVNLGGYAFSYRQINNEQLSKGRFEISDGQIKLYGYGSDLWTAPDSFGYLYTRTEDENLSITVKLDSLTGTTGARRAGIMFRQSTESSEKMVMLSIGTGGSGLQFGVRTGIAGGLRELAFDRAVRDGYIRLEKEGSNYSAYYSSDGIEFKKIYEKTVGVSFTGEYLAGIVTATVEGEGYFSNLSVNGDDVFVSNDITNVKASAGNGKVTVSWTDPTEQNSRTFEKIIVTCTDKETSEKQVIEAEKGEQKAELTGLENGKEYEITVQAKNAYNALSSPITLTAVPTNVDSLTSAGVTVSGSSAIRGKKTEASVAFDNMLPVEKMELTVSLPNALEYNMSDVTLAQEFKNNGASVTDTGSGFKIEYGGANAPVYPSDIVSFKASSTSAGTYTIGVTGSIVCRTSDGTEKTLSISVTKEGRITVTSSDTNSGSSTGNGGGAGGGGYATGGVTDSTTDGSIALQTPFPLFDGNNGQQKDPYSRYADENQISDWAKTAVEELSKKNIVSGSMDENGTVFNPQNNVTRAEFTKLCVSAFAKVSDSAVCSFTDVHENDWYYPYIATAQELGIINGYEDGSFGVDDPITRQEMSAIIYRISERGSLTLSAKNQREIYNDDAQIEDWAKEAVYKMQEAGIISGYGDGIFAPNDNATREMSARVIYNALSGGASASTSQTDLSLSSAQSIDKFSNLMRLAENLGVVEDGSKLSSEQSIKRKDAVKYAVRAYLNATYPAADTVFADVKSDVSESGYIQTAADLGLIDSGEYFYPNNDITVAELAKLFVNMINHSFEAESSGGDPSAYIVVAHQEKIINNINIAKEAVTNEEFFEMLKNALTVSTFDKFSSKKAYSLFLKQQDHEIEEKATITAVDKRRNVITVSGKSGTFELSIPDNYQTQELLDITGDVWYDQSKDELIFVDISKKYEVRYDYIYGINGRYAEDLECLPGDISTINLYSDNKRYSLQSATIRYNGKIADGLISPMNCFVRVLIESGRIKSVSMYKLEEGGILTGVTNTRVVYRQGNAANKYVDKIDEIDNIEAIVDGKPCEWKSLPTNAVMDYYADNENAIFVVSTNKTEGKLSNYSGNRIIIGDERYNLENGYGRVWFSNNEGAEYSNDPDNLLGTTVTAMLDFSGRVRYVTGAKETDNYVLGVITSWELNGFEITSVMIYGNHSGTAGVKRFKLDLAKSSEVKEEDLLDLTREDTFFKYYISGDTIRKIERIDWLKCNNDLKNNISSAANATLVDIYGQDRITKMREDPYVFLTGWTFGIEKNLYRVRFEAQTEAGVNFTLTSHFDGAIFMTAYDQDGYFNPAMTGWGDYRNGWFDRMFVKVGYTKDNTNRFCPDVIYILSNPRWARSNWDVFGIVEEVAVLPDNNYMLSMIEPGNIRTEYIVRGDEIYGEYDRQMPKAGDEVWIKAMGYFEELYYNAEGNEITESEAAELEEKGEDVTSEIIYTANGYAYVEKIFDLPNEIGAYDNNIMVTEVDNIYAITGNFMYYYDEETGYSMPITAYTGGSYVVEGSEQYLMYDYEDFVNHIYEPKTYNDLNTIKNNGYSDRLLIFSVGGGRYPKLILIMP